MGSRNGKSVHYMIKNEAKWVHSTALNNIENFLHKVEFLIGYTALWYKW